MGISSDPFTSGDGWVLRGCCLTRLFNLESAGNALRPGG